MKQNIQVSELFIYPVKSFAGIQLKSSEVDSMGLKYDRRWMLVSPKGDFMTQRTIPKMALVNTTLDNGQLSLSTKGGKSHQVPLTSTTSEKMDVVVWNDRLRVSKVGSATDAWLSEVLGEDCHLVYIEDDVVRQCDLEFSEEGERI